MRFGYVFWYLAGWLFLGLMVLGTGPSGLFWVSDPDCGVSCDSKDGLGECSRRVKIAVCRHCDGVYAWWAAVAVLHVSVGWLRW